ncbi:hypothetical protein [Rhodopseudomonas telluris]|uniref:Uncharacterized protein n=1 Tax=Rhodopseudomonas telluris TaxID=644215 RepID=A0ABV6EUD6_9BRAD
MEWGYILALGIGALAGYGFKPKAKPVSQDTSRFSRASAIDRSNLLQAYSRELSNYLIQLDPERYYSVYSRAFDEQERLFAADAKLREAELLILTERYPQYENFDFVGTRPYVVYESTFERYDAEDIEEHFVNLVKFHSLQRAGSEAWRELFPMLSTKEREHLVKYIREVKDKKFKERLKQAVREYRLATVSKPIDFETPDGGLVYENQDIAVFRLYDIAENAEGYWFKDTDEYGVHSSFYDDERDKSYESWYRSDRIFKKREVLMR